MKYTYWFILVILATNLSAQSEDLIFVNGLDVNEERYPDIKDSPYLFGDEWHPADLLTKEMKRVPNMPTRYNIYTGEFEVRQGDKFIRLANDRFMRIEFEVNEDGEKVDNADEKLVFQASFHPRFRDHFVNLIYSGSTMVVFRDFRAIVSEKTVQNVGQTVEFKRFFPKVDYYLMQNGELKTIKPNKKTLIKLLGHKKELEAYIKEHKLDLESAPDLNKLLTFAETLS
ncbi:hypothetical protein [Flavilitoribacter nigricans]|uniref:Uncharacterized protein n=1 Tax=Flavilitoribacter nigricans (strain ATCC 23147 / DSM 23189 / NBRC 102662 / NCIMB 1420 / SS-2) TaxID=1122177 RepID=A0A2D0N0G3_FLAN2|nr:hypothetical protein [Flavilitoribacter nigricans]PHN02021.1 hypothetical protein CRP01_33845 [Flavilitoribacter nigricans DSM 23189 = NBRC 102662]